MQLVLTRREEEVLCLIAAGLADKEIGRRLGMARSTASNHVSVILLKLGAHNRAEAAALWAAERAGTAGGGRNAR